MSPPLSKKLYHREVAPRSSRAPSYHGLYTDPQLITDLDLVNELAGHSGCVNALSWSKSGSLLASGSDDQHLNIHTYQPHDNNQFQLTATVATGHRQNIFSVKFMPHSNDRTVITAAGDGEVRVFDLEYTGQHTPVSRASHFASEGRRLRLQHLYANAKYLDDGNTNCRVYRSHADRVKRIVTESSPHLFLTCSEDGDVRQWDLRQPSSAYPSPRQTRRGPDIPCPPPLISYSRYRLDLNTISCSASQPHYIALGGAHLHAFLHDRRMTGRDKLLESGQPLPPIQSMSQHDQELLTEATQCVRRFAPRRQSSARAGDRGHITACKISDARPDEMIVSWSGDHIYSFDLVRETESPQPKESSTSTRVKSKQGGERKRKRAINSNNVSPTHDESSSALLRAPVSRGEAALRISYTNGQSEDIPISDEHLEDPPTDADTRRERFARRVVVETREVYTSLFLTHVNPNMDTAVRFAHVYEHAARILPEMDTVMREWTYPLNPSRLSAAWHRKRRKQREAGRRFIQAAGVLARVVAGPVGPSSILNPDSEDFSYVQSRRSNETDLSPKDLFCYTFLKAILLWLDSGIGRVIEGFTRPAGMPVSTGMARGLPIPESEAGTEAIDEYLVPYLNSIARLRPGGGVFDLSSSQGSTDPPRRLFNTDDELVAALAEAIKRPFADLSSSATSPASGERQDAATVDRQQAREFWGHKVGTSLLFGAAADRGASFMQRAFGGPGGIHASSDEEDWGEDAVDDDDMAVDPQPLDARGVGSSIDAHELTRGVELTLDGNDLIGHDDDDVDDEYDEEDVFDYGPDDDVLETYDGFDDDEFDGDDDEEDHDNDDDDEDDDDNLGHIAFDDEEPDWGIAQLGSRLVFPSRQKHLLHNDVPSSSPTRTYRGHRNSQTVKDVNYFGPNDEYVVSGSDDGNFFIWDRKTSKLVNVLEGDGEVVNVIQGHPYETMLAVSGIDHTIKIFSPDARARDVARLGQGVFAHDASQFSSLSWPSRSGYRLARDQRQQLRRDQETVIAAVQAEVAAGPTSDPIRDPDSEEDAYVAPNGLRSRKRMDDMQRILRENEEERQGGGNTYITLPAAQILQMLFGQLDDVQEQPVE